MIISFDFFPALSQICESYNKLQREQQVLRNRLNTEMQQYKEQAVPDSVIAFLRGEQE